jgi:gliding motility-associated-like protein
MIKKCILSLFCLLFLSNTLFSQIANLPDTIPACKNTSEQLSPNMVATGTGTPNYIDTFWTPTTGLSNPNIINPIVSVGTTNQNYVLTVQAVTANELIINGDFSLGSTVFYSDYVYGTGGTYGLLSLEGQYAVSTNPSLTHTGFANFGDHTTGTGSMMVVNGADSLNTAIWCQTIAVNPNTWYDFSAWGATCVANNTAILQFSINSTLIGTPLALPNTNGLWTQFNATWFSGTNTSINICINDQQVATSGNDFAIDDISFREIISIMDSVYFKTVNLTPSIQPQLHLGCSQDSVKFYAQNGSGDTPSNYAWSFGDGAVSSQKNPFHIYAAQGIYPVKLVVEKNGCKDSVTYNVDLTHSFSAKFYADDSACTAQLVSLLNQSPTPINTTIVNTNVIWGDGTIDNQLTHTYTTPGNYTIIFILTDAIGCKDSFSRSITVVNSPFVVFNTSQDVICIGQPIVFLDSVSNTNTFDWNFGDGNSLYDVHNPAHLFDLPGNFTVTLTGRNSVCLTPTNFTKNITVNPYPQVNLGSDTAICSGLTGSILLTNNFPATGSYLWNTGETTNSILVNTPNHYWLQVSNGNCATTDSVWVKNDCYINIPNSFSPNNDGLNDYFIPREILSSGLLLFKMSIYNRWGEKIYYTDKIDGKGWDGKYNNKPQESGVYIYSMDVVFKNGLRKNFTGNVTLLK